MKLFFFSIFYIVIFEILCMLKKNQSNFYLALLKRTKKMKYEVSVYDLVLVKKRNHGYLFVVEKLGSVNFKVGLININYFRLIYWLSHNPGSQPKCTRFLFKFIISKWKN